VTVSMPSYKPTLPSARSSAATGLQGSLMVLKPLIPALLALGAAAWAADDAASPAAQPQAASAPAAASSPGFELSFLYAMPNDSRFSGSAVGYHLFLSFGNDVEVGLYREEGSYHGRDGDASVSERAHFDAVRASYRFFDDEAQSAKLIAAAGYERFASHRPVGAFAFDLGIAYDPWKISARPVSSSFGVSVIYRYCRFSDVELLEGQRPVNDAGGLLVGVHGIVTF
jgi:hypothetical protein